MSSAAQPRPRPGPTTRQAQIGAWQVSLLPASAYEACYTPQSGILGFAFDPQVGEHAFGTDKRSAFTVRAGSLSWVPAGCDVYSTSDQGGEYLHISGTIPLGNDTRFRDRPDIMAASAALRLRAALLRGDAPLTLEGLILTLIERARDLARTRAPASAAGWMTPQRVKRVEAMIDARLGETLLVADIAAALGISPGHLTRAFRRTFGRSLQAHLIERRLQRARDLIEATDLPLARIAAECGFASHAHMTVQFNKRFQLAPSILRS